jgi:hypothetical protein
MNFVLVHHVLCSVLLLTMYRYTMCRVPYETTNPWFVMDFVVIFGSLVSLLIGTQAGAYTRPLFSST